MPAYMLNFVTSIYICSAHAYIHVHSYMYMYICKESLLFLHSCLQLRGLDLCMHICTYM